MNSNLFSDIKIIKTNLFEDKRGSFTEIFNKNEFIKNDLNDDFVQDNVSFSKKAGTIRGLHFQNGKFSQSKLLRVLSGEIQDVFIDIRKDSNTFEKYGFQIMNPETGWIYIPEGYAHGFCTLTDDVSVLYKVGSYYSSDNEFGIKWNDEFFNIKWILKERKPIVSSKDDHLPTWSDIKNNIEL